MAKTFPVGHIRVNPNTFQTEMWDGSCWQTTTTGVLTTNVGSSYITSNGNGYTTTINSKPTISATEREMIFDFLKENMRVAEYVDDKGKITTVQLEMRAGPDYIWENIRRVKTTDPL